MLAKSKLSTIEVLIAMTAIDSHISNDEFVLINNALKEYDKMKKKKKNQKFKSLNSLSKILVHL